MQNVDQDVQSRDQFGSRWGFILAAAGSAVGLGNLWRFPKEVGSNGGGAFVILYLFFIILLGGSMVLAEFVIGRRGKGSAVECYSKVNKNFKWVGYLGMIAVIVLLAFYAIIGGWTISYTFKAVTGGLSNLSSDELGGLFGGLVSNVPQLLLNQVLFLGATAYIVAKGIAGGIEKYCKVLMPLLFVLLVIMAIRSVTLPGAMAGVIWYLKPDFSAINSSVIVGALGQAFFSLSLGTGGMVTYASYLNKKENLGSTALSVTIADTSVALLAGFIIIPAVFAFNLEVGAGPGLVFITLPQVFANMPFGSLFAVVFFFLLFVAALTSSIGMLEVGVAFLEERMSMSRQKLTWLATGIVFVLGIPPLLSFGPWSHITFAGRNFLDMYDYFVSNLSIPLVGLLTAVLLGFVWKKEDVMDEATSEGAYQSAIYSIWYKVMKFVIPIILGVVYLQALGIIKV